MMNKFDREYYENGLNYWQQVIVFYSQYQITTDGYNLLLDMKDEVPGKSILKFLKKLKKCIRLFLILMSIIVILKK